MAWLNNKEAAAVTPSRNWMWLRCVWVQQLLGGAHSMGLLLWGAWLLSDSAGQTRSDALSSLCDRPISEVTRRNDLVPI